MIKNYMNTVCKLLKMKSPLLELAPRWKMKSQVVYYEPQKNKIIMLKKRKYNIQECYELSKQLRYIWQNHNSKKINELDADAFASVSVKIIFGKVVQRKYKNDEYWKRLEELKEEYLIDF